VNLLNSPVPAASVLGAGHLMFYFSAHWYDTLFGRRVLALRLTENVHVRRCPPCRAFTPKLIKWYTEKKAAGLDAEIIFVSGDKSAAEFAEYHGGMPWPALAFTDKATIATLNDAFEVEGIPTLVVTTRDGRLLTKDGVSRVSAEPDGFPWPPKPCEVCTAPVLCEGGLLLCCQKVTCAKRTGAAASVARRRCEPARATSLE
jgi:hypothetical protein